MATHDYVIDNQSATSFRSDLNSVLQAIVSTNSNATAPATTYANQLWYDTATNILKKRNEANSAWINLGTIDEAAGTFTPSGGGTLASQAQAEAGTNNTALMTPLRTAQAITALTTVTSLDDWSCVTASASTSAIVIEAGAQYIIIACGGGGGGATQATGSVNTDTKSLGGNGGSVVIAEGVVSTATTLTVTIGAGGAQRSTTGNGNAGTATTVVGGTINITAAGGSGGINASPGTAAVASIPNPASSGGTVYEPGLWNVGTHTDGNISFSGTAPFGGGGTAPGLTTTGMSSANDAFNSRTITATMGAFNVFYDNRKNVLWPFVAQSVYGGASLVAGSIFSPFSSVLAGYAGNAGDDTDPSAGAAGGGGGGGSDSSGMIGAAGGGGWVIVWQKGA